MSDKKELAEKVAGMLGIIRYDEFDNMYFPNENITFNKNEPYKSSGINYLIDWSVDNGPFYSWPTVGLCIEKAREISWHLNVQQDFVTFEWWLIGDETPSIETSMQVISDVGDIEAIIRAFAEIPIENREVNIGDCSNIKHWPEEKTNGDKNGNHISEVP